MMGVCFDCLAEIDGVPNRQSCMVPVRPGMRIRRQRGAAPARPVADGRSGDRRPRDHRGRPGRHGGGGAGRRTRPRDRADRRAGRPGGQIYRAIERAGEDGRRTRRSAPIISPAARSPRRCAPAAYDYRPGTTVWHIDPGGRTAALQSLSPATDGSETIAARRILLATGAIERPVPIPGWTLPGVMTAGAAQILLKTADLVPEGRTVLAGQGPLLYLAAMQLARAGAPPLAVLETTPPRELCRRRAACRRLVGGAPRPGQGAWP